MLPVIFSSYFSNTEVLRAQPAMVTEGDGGACKFLVFTLHLSWQQVG